MGDNDYFVLRGSVVLADGILEEGMVVIRGNGSHMWDRRCPDSRIPGGSFPSPVIFGPD